MKKRIFMLLLFAVIVFINIRLSAKTIEKEMERVLKIYIVRFDTGGANEIIEKQAVVEGQKAIKPSIEPTKQNHFFVDWVDRNGKVWDFETPITKNVTIYAKWNFNKNYKIIEGEEKNYFSLRFPNYKSCNKNNAKSKTLSNVNGKDLIEMESSSFSKDDIYNGIDLSGSKSSYGGCGPIAMMGIMYYFSDAFGYFPLLENPYNEFNRIALAYEVLKNTPTYEIGFSSKSLNAMEPLKSGGEKDTFTNPSDYITGFNNVLNNHNLANFISVQNIGICVDIKGYVIDSTDSGMPLTLYTAFIPKGEGDDAGEFEQHYLNIYGYSTWDIVDEKGNSFSQTLYYVRRNWRDKVNILMDADLVQYNLMAGIITYSANKNPNIGTHTHSFDIGEAFIDNLHIVKCTCGQLTSGYHQYDHSYNVYDKTYHKNLCVCGHYILEEHSMGITLSTKPRCTKCGYQSTGSIEL